MKVHPGLSTEGKKELNIDFGSVPDRYVSRVLSKSEIENKLLTHI